jgi:hypothetical protein
MKLLTIDHFRMWAVAVLVVVLFANGALAQFSKGKSRLPQPPDAASGGIPFGGQMTPEQIRDIYWWRAMQARGSRGVQTGFPQFDPFGPAAFMGFPVLPQDVQSQATGKTSAQKRADARAAREEKKRIARENAAAKKAAAEKAKAEARAKAKHNPKDPA